MSIRKIDGVTVDADTLDGEAPAAFEDAGVAAGLITTHAEGASHRWTDEKLRKGAGAGAAPDEISIPAARTIVTGSYTGNNADARRITTGFKCSKVVVMDLVKGSQWVSIPSAGIKHWDGAPYHDAFTTQDTNVLLHATDGFIVDNSNSESTNYSARAYQYWAVSE